MQKGPWSLFKAEETKRKGVISEVKWMNNFLKKIIYNGVTKEHLLTTFAD